MDVKESTMVRPMGETQRGSVWLSSLDLVMPATHHTRSIYLYVSDGATNFFDTAVLKAALGRALVDFYPYAGRLGEADDGRMEIKCNAEGVLFVEAHCGSTLQDLGGHPDLTLVPKVDYSQGIATFPLLLLQISRFKCGSVCLGVANEHHISDGISALHFINTWSDMARGITAAAVPPFLERRLLSARRPPQPQFPHEEYQPPPPLKTRLPGSDTSHSTFHLTPDLVNALKHTCKSGYTTYEVVAGHVWRCVCISRGLAPDQETKLQIPVDGRSRLQPPLPPGFFGNGIFYTTSTALCGELASNPLEFAVEKVHAALLQMNDDYLRSAVDYLELRLPNDIYNIARSENNVRCPNFGITTWVRLPFYEADFGWGKPVYAGPAAPQFEGKALLFLGAHKNLLLAITLLNPHMDAFHNMLYNI